MESSRYNISEQLHESTNSLVCRAIDISSKQKVILKILKNEFPSPYEVNQYRLEYKIIRSFNVDGVIKAYELIRYGNSWMMVLEDFGGQSLEALISKRQVNLSDGLSISIKITNALLDIHKAGIVHKDINPSNIVYNTKTGQLKLIDFGISTKLFRDIQVANHFEKIEGTLAYIAPEQTGRTNRKVDFRSDLYSLGITLYELLTSHPPFDTDDPISLIHHHLARQPKAPHQLIPSIPLTVSKIVMKLMAKAPEERYQTAWGLKVDLEECLQQLKNSGIILDFLIGVHDASGDFQLSPKLYGRRQEIQKLLALFDKVKKGSNQLVMISGYSGIGKSALVQEVQRAILRQQGYFISGKFDQLKRDLPYTAIAQAFQVLIRQILAGTEAEITVWRRKILEILSSNVHIISNIIPELEQIIGKQLSVNKADVVEDQNKLNLIFQNFIDIFVSKEHPLVIFIDDLQWADLSSLKLIESLVVNREHQYLLVIGAYRDNEIDPTHPLQRTLENINEKNILVDSISLHKLSMEYVSQFICDTLNCSIKEVEPLSKLVWNKTHGNPFFFRQLLMTLYEDNLLVFDSSEKSWKWDIKRIQNVSITDNVIDLMIHKIGKLNHKTQKIIKLASCIGNRFNLDILSIVNCKSPIITAEELQSALEEGFVEPLNNDSSIPLFWNLEIDLDSSFEISNNHVGEISASLLSIEYQFLHDRVQQAAYLLISEKDKKQIHLQIGQLLLKNIKGKKKEENIYEIVNHLNIGKELLNLQSERDNLARLNLEAGVKAQAAAAYPSALNYFKTAIDLIERPCNHSLVKDENSWKRDYQLTFNSYTKTAEIANVLGDFNVMEEMTEVLLHNAQSIMDKVKTYEVRLQAYFGQQKSTETLQVGIEALKLLGIELSHELTSTDLEDRLHRTKHQWLDKNIEDFLDLPEMMDLEKQSAIRILFLIAGLASVEFPDIYPISILESIDLLLKYGNISSCSSVYASYGIILCGVTRDIEAGYKFGQLAINLLEKFNDKESKVKTIYVFNTFIRHWQEHIRESFQPFLDLYQYGIEIGDLGWGCLAPCMYVLHAYWSGEELSILDQKIIDYRNAIDQYNQELSIRWITLFQWPILKLLDVLDDRDLTPAAYDEDIMVSTYKKKNDQQALCWFYINKIFISYLFDEYEAAIEQIETAKKYLNIAIGLYTVSIFNFYHSLSLLSIFSDAKELQKRELMTQIIKNQEEMKIWVHYAPMNFQHKYHLIEAEVARVLGERWRASELYDKALEGAKENSFLQEEALIYEQAAKFYLAIGRKEVGQVYLKNAYQCYSSWGAKAKLYQLERKYSEYILGIGKKSRNTATSVTIEDEGSLDVITIIKASQSLSSEINLKKLIESLIKFVTENAGAQKAFLILNYEGNLWIEAQCTSEQSVILQSVSIGTVDPKKSVPILPSTIINYVRHAQKNIVLHDAVNEGQFIRDPYIVAHKSKSILCTPLLNQGQLKGILYLENNLTTGAFTADRVELLNILAAQAAISIDNSRLYETLEQRVEERTKELSQTLDVLKATQAELLFENDLLRNEEQPSTFDYQVGGSLPMDSPTYVVRSADRTLYKTLRQGEFCYILNARQMGKSSLMVRMINHLQSEGVSCAAIDMTRIGSENVTPEQWYKGLAVELWRSFGLLRAVKLKTWWNERMDISPVQRLGQFIEEVILVEVGKDSENNPSSQKLVLFIDEIDSVLGLDFPVSDFFRLIRSCYNQRTLMPEYQRLTFALFGVATPSELIGDRRLTPFNIGQSIPLQGFKEHEAQPLLNGLKDKVTNPQVLLREVLSWTGGQPFLTQKICKFIHQSSMDIPINQEAQWIEDLVRNHVIDEWESKDEPEHLKTIRDRIVNTDQSLRVRSLYHHILTQEAVESTDSAEEKELILSGLVIKREGILRVHNRIYQVIFNVNWIESLL